MKKVMVLGSGRIGRCITSILSSRSGVKVTLADKNEGALDRENDAIETLVLDVTDEAFLAEKLQPMDAVVSACQYPENPGIARAALAAGASYFDLTEDVATTKIVRDLASNARPGQIFVPQCGLAPGFIGILGAKLASQFETLDTLKLRVGALPEIPSNAMLYNLTWSTEGLINEYVNPCDAITKGKFSQVQALEGLETFALGGATFEAFNTSGGLGTLCETLEGKVRELSYKTIRYPGHRQLMDFLINGLRLGEEGRRRDLLKQIFEEAVPVTDQDIVLILVAATGYIDGKLVQKTEHHWVRHGSAFDPSWSAIQITTAGSIAVVVDLFLNSKLTGQGFVAQEEISYEQFMQNDLAKPYRESAHLWKNEHGLA